jgi:hypothetical protein
MSCAALLTPALRFACEDPTARFGRPGNIDFHSDVEQLLCQPVDLDPYKKRKDPLCSQRQGMSCATRAV